MLSTMHVHVLTSVFVPGYGGLVPVLTLGCVSDYPSVLPVPTLGFVSGYLLDLNSDLYLLYGVYN